MNKIQDFITNNALDLSGQGSELNGNCLLIASYASYLKFDEDELIKNIEILNLNRKSYLEILRLFDYANKHNYAKVWKTEDYKKKYIY